MLFNVLSEILLNISCKKYNFSIDVVHVDLCNICERAMFLCTRACYVDARNVCFDAESGFQNVAWNIRECNFVVLILH